MPSADQERLDSDDDSIDLYSSDEEGLAAASLSTKSTKSINNSDNIGEEKEAKNMEAEIIYVNACTHKRYCYS